jgi:hypothetical protein
MIRIITMTQLMTFLRNRWDEILITCVYLNAVVASIFTWDVTKVLQVSLGGLALLAVIFTVRWLVQKRQTPMRGQNLAFQIPRGGLIFTVGLQPETIRLAVKHQKPKYFGFICTARSEPVVSQLKEELSCNDENCNVKIVNSNDIKDVRTETGLIIDWMTSKGLKTSEIAADITGGTTTMSVGVFSMTEERHVYSQYIFCRQYDEKNRCVNGTQEAVLVSRYASG